MLALGLTGMAKALDDQRRQPDIAALAFEERLALLLDRETMERENKRLVARLRFAALRQEAVVEDVDLRAPRGLDRTPSWVVVHAPASSGLVRRSRFSLRGSQLRRPASVVPVSRRAR